MAGTQNTISSLLAQFLRLQKNSLEIINGLNQVAVSTNDSVTIEMLDEQGLPQNVNIPSYGFMRGEIQRLDSNIRSLAGIGNNSATVRNPDGTYSQVFKSETLKEPPRLTNLSVPSTFGVKDNWFFESFLSPLLFVSVNVTGQISDSADRIVVKRIIANTQTDEQKNYFDNVLKGRNDLGYDQFLQELGNNGIGYFVDEDIVQLPLRTIRYIGDFGVIGYYDDNVTSTDANGNTFQEIRRNYKLDKLSYTDTLVNVIDGKSLNINDQIATPDGSLYLITSVDNDQSSIQAKRLSGYQPIQIGAKSISISSTDFGPRNVQINVGFDERQGIFFKTIDDNFNIVSASWSTGVIFWSNELQTKDSSGQVVTLENYYLNNVSDLGKVFLGAAKENKIPAIQAVQPDAPLVTTDSFKVVQINKQVTDSTSAKVIEDKLNLKTQLKSEIDALDEAINQTRLQLNSGQATSNNRGRRRFFLDSGADRNIEDTQFGSRRNNDLIAQSQLTTPPGANIASITASLNSLIDERTNKSQLYASLVDEINVLVNDVPQIITQPKYRVRGFWPIPAPKEDPVTGPQNVIQFSVRYRYLNDGGSAQPSENIEFVDNDGQKKNASFSNWTEYKTDIRKKVYSDSKGIYVWADEITSDSNVQNINQLDIPITKGEKVEIQIMSISEGGWPDNAQTSDFSESVIISFPDSLSVTGISDTLATNNQDASVVRMQRTLDSQGLPVHLSQQFTSGDKVYFHDTLGIASGFFNSAGAVISLFDKINDMQNQINAGFFSDIFSDPLGSDAGKIASFTYNIQLFNPSASILELASTIPGGLSQQAPIIDSGEPGLPAGYDDNLGYGSCPISITSLTTAEVSGNQSFRQSPPFASTNSKSQFIYPRFRSVGFDQDLYTGGIQTGQSFSNSFIANYTYNGSDGISIIPYINFGVNDTYPQNGSCMIPYNPLSTPSTVIGATSANVWSGTYSGVTGGTPNGGGNISEFCIDVRHPYLISIGQTTSFTNYDSLVKPYSDGLKTYPPFRHTQTFWGDTSLNQYWVQQKYRLPDNATTSSSTPRNDNMYSDKLGFTSNDQFLIGKYSCGAYLYLAPSSASSVQVSGSTSLSTTELGGGDSNAINVPLVFQFRPVDKAGYIGGWRKSGNLSNITYTKKIGIDIQAKNSDIFSFDVQVTGSYKNDTLVAPNFDSGSST